MRAFLSSVLSLMLGNVFSLVVGTIFSFVLVTKLSNDELGLQGGIVSFSNMVMMLAFLGIFSVMLRELSSKTEAQQVELYHSLMSMLAVLALVAVIVGAIVALLLNSFPDKQFFILLCGMFTLVLSYAPVAPTEALLMVRGQMWRVAVIQSGYALWTAAAGIVILMTGGGIGAIYFVLVFVSLIEIAFYLIEVRRMNLGGLRFVFRPREWWHYIQLALPSGLAMFFFVSTRSLGTFLIYTFTGSAAAGYLYLSYQIMHAVVQIVWVPYSVTILPIMTRLYAEAQDKFAWLSGRSITWLIAGTVPAAVGATLLAPEILALFGPSKIEAAPVLQIFIWTLVVSVAVEFFSRMLLVIDRQSIYIAAAAIGAVINIVLSLLLIPRQGAAGAALAAVIGTAAIALISGIGVRGWLRENLKWADGLRLLLATVVMIAAVQLVAAAQVNWSISPVLALALKVIVGALVYGGLTLILGLFRLEDWHTARHVLRVSAPNTVSTESRPIDGELNPVAK
jgi:O-antigen/teichoic acid export membrane protein